MLDVISLVKKETMDQESNTISNKLLILKENLNVICIVNLNLKLGVFSAQLEIRTLVKPLLKL
jgi:hypothetical protein